MNKEWNYGILDDAVDKGSSNISLNKIKEEVGDYPVFGAKGFMKNVSFYQQQKEYLGIIKDGAGIGRVSKHPAKSSILATMQYIIPKEEYEIDFVRYFLESLDFENYRTGSTIPHIYYKDYKSAKFPLVNKQEQKQIVAILDKAFTAIDQAKANIEKNIENAKELFQSKLNAIFSQKGDGWEEKTLGEVASYDKTRYTLADKPYVGLEDIESNSGKFLGNQEAREVKSSTFQFDNRHVLYGRLRPYLNKVLLPEFLGHCSTEIFPILPTKELLREFLFYWFLTPSTVEKIDATWTGARMPRANMNEVIKFSIPIPSIEIQTQTSKQLSILKKNTDNIISNYQSKLDFIEDLKKSILQKAFAGALTQKEVVV